MSELEPITEAQKTILAKGLGDIAQRYTIHLQTCAQNTDYTKFGIHPSDCITLDILGKANNIKFKKLKHKGMRENCNCIESRDIGFYDTCLNGCRYCYANSTPDKAIENYKKHNPKSPILLGGIKETDVIQEGNQKSFIEIDDINLKLF